MRRTAALRYKCIFRPRGYKQTLRVRSRRPTEDALIPNSRMAQRRAKAQAAPEQTVSPGVKVKFSFKRFHK
jgi:hypothetical protein